MTTRRKFLAAGAATTLLAGAGSARAVEEMSIRFSAYEKIPAQKFPWGWIRWVMNAEIDPRSEMTLGLVFIEANQSNPLHTHPNSQEVLHMLSGACEHLVGDRWHSLKAGDTLLIPKDAVHGVRTQDQPCLVTVAYNTGKREMVPYADDSRPKEAK